MKSVWKHQLKCRSIKLFIILPTALISIRENASHFISRYNQNETQLLHVRLVQTLYKLEIPGSLLQIPFLPSHGWIEWGLSSSHQCWGDRASGWNVSGRVGSTRTVLVVCSSAITHRSHYADCYPIPCFATPPQKPLLQHMRQGFDWKLEGSPAWLHRNEIPYSLHHNKCRSIL